MTLFEDLKWRGLIKDVAGEEADLQKVLDGAPFSFYWGTDPTADSLHLGHYSSLCMAKRLANAGHHPVLLCGGATGRIGDPRPTAEREIISEERVNANINGIRNQIKTLVPTAELVDNYDWMKNYTFLNFLRDIGKYINVNYMLDKDIIRRRLETGITFAEFSYMLLQGYDFMHLYQEKNCIMQVAGSDQWGNITTGVDLIRKNLDKTAYAFTMPLILDPSGKKFGKSEGNALWLDKEKTSPYEIYQYLINSDDSKVLEYLKVFTFLSKEEIEDIYKQQQAAPETRIAQKTLAWEVVKDIHGKAEADNYDWMKNYTFLNFLRDIGKYINVNYMLDKDIIRRRLETGITFAEFSYMLLQGYDFMHLYQEKNCIMQVAGSDQWGNITTGVDLIRKNLDKTAYAFTMPLILDPSGKKFGKSEGNALWLDKEKTSPYEIYQYLINSDDSKVLEYLKVFTFLSKEEIEDIYKQQQAAPETRIAQKTLAWEVVKDIHGKAEADNAVNVSQKLFAGDFKGLSVKDIKSGMKSVPSFDFTEELPLVDVLVNNKIASSKREAREFISGNAISVNGEVINDPAKVITKDMAIEGEILIFRRGKKKYFIGNIVK